MGMYTGLRLRANLKEETMAQWKPVIDIMLEGGPGIKRPDDIEDHPLFHTDRWSWMLKGTSAYLEPDFMPNSKLDYGNEFFAQFNIKNYSGEIEAFLDWISPHIDVLFAASTRYEEAEKETIIRMVNGKLTNTNF